MRITEFENRVNLAEGIVIKNAIELAAYCVTVAEAYDAAPENDPAAHRYWAALNKHNNEVLIKRLRGSGITIFYSAEDPYGKYTDVAADQAKFMLYDMVVNHRLQIFTGFSDSHPYFSEQDNVTFRTVHDFYAHGTMRKKFLEEVKSAARVMQMKTLPPIEDAAALLSRVRLGNQPNKRSPVFTAKGELAATFNHMLLAPRDARPALFTEVIGQVCYQTVVGNFPVQKVAILSGFDYQNLEACTGATQIRMYGIIEEIKSGQPTIGTKIAAKTELNCRELLSSVRSH